MYVHRYGVCMYIGMVCVCTYIWCVYVHRYMLVTAFGGGCAALVK